MVAEFFYSSAERAVPGPNAMVPSFESKFARLTYTGAERFTLSFMRYTGEWIELYEDLSVEECLEAIKTDAYFHP